MISQSIKMIKPRTILVLSVMAIAASTAAISIAAQCSKLGAPTGAVCDDITTDFECGSKPLPGCGQIGPSTECQRVSEGSYREKAEQSRGCDGDTGNPNDCCDSAASATCLSRIDQVCERVEIGGCEVEFSASGEITAYWAKGTVGITGTVTRIQYNCTSKDSGTWQPYPEKNDMGADCSS